MKTLFQSMTNKAGCTFGAVSSSCACSLIHALGTVLAVSLFVIAIISVSVISIMWIIMLSSIIITTYSLINNKIGYSQKNLYAAA